MKPTPITDILNNKLSKLHSELDSLIIKKVKKDITLEQWNALDQITKSKLDNFITLSFMRDGVTIDYKIKLFKILEEL